MYHNASVANFFAPPDGRALRSAHPTSLETGYASVYRQDMHPSIDRKKGGA